MGRRIVLVILVALAAAALFTAIFAGFYHAGYWGPAGGHVMRFGPGYYGYGGGYGFFPGFFLFPLILLLILAVVFWRPWHRHYWHYGYGPRGRGYWGPGPYGPGPYGPGALGAVRARVVPVARAVLARPAPAWAIPTPVPT